MFTVVLNSSLQDADVVRISNTQNITLVTIIEDQDIDRMLPGLTANKIYLCVITNRCLHWNDGSVLLGS